MKRVILQTSMFFLPFISLAQEKMKDTVSHDIDEIVITGQFEPQSLKKSVHNVRVISRENIQKLAANNLGDVLNQYLNITVRPNSRTGRSSVSMFGLDAQYFKILVDNVPLVSDSGLGNNVDLSQINLDDIQQIEIIEGSMGVTHGANAVSGILNIITKKSFGNKWEISATLQEETVGKEYAMFDKGRHIQGLKIGHTVTDNWFVSIGANRNDLTGYLGDQKGKDHAVNDGLRGYSWLPKEQLVTNAMINYRRNDFRFFYKFDYMNDVVDFYNRSVNVITNPPFGETKISNDERYFTNRFFHHINGVGSIWNKIKYNISLSHQKQKRDLETYKYNLNEKSEFEKKKVKDQSSEVFYSTGTFNNFFESEKFDLQLGYETVNNIGFSVVDAPNGLTKDVRKRIDNYDFFVSSEYKITDRLFIRPGARISFQSLFDTQNAVSLGFRQLYKSGIEMRASLGKSFRTPNFEELYSQMIIPAHSYIGNENLIPERSTSYEFSLKKTTGLTQDLIMHNNLVVSHTSVKDKIGMAVIEFLPQQKSQYINIDKYEMVNFASTNQFNYKEFRFTAGFSLVGVSQVIDGGEAVSDDRFLYTLQMNGSLAYQVPKWNTVFSLFYKYNGKQEDFVATTDENGEPTYKLASIEAFSWMDASIRKSFYNRQFEVTLGARNLFDVADVRRSTPGSGGAHAISNTTMLAYGRSYFLKLVYNFNF